MMYILHHSASYRMVQLENDTGSILWVESASWD